MDRLDPALLRPGRIDRKIPYSLATKEQAAALFVHFFPKLNSSKDAVDSIALAAETEGNISYEEFIAKLSEAFASHVPPDEFSTAELQGYLLGCKKQPEQAVAGIAEWIEQERQYKQERRDREEATKRKAKEKRESLTRPNALPVPPTLPSGASSLPLLLPTVGQTAENLLTGVINDEQPLSPSPAYEASEGTTDAGQRGEDSDVPKT